MTKAQRELVAQVDAIDNEWHEADAERRGELKILREDLLSRSDVAEALGARYAEKQAKGTILQ